MLKMYEDVILKFKEHCHGYNERFTRMRSALRAPNKKMEPKDETIYLWREKKYIHNRLTKNTKILQIYI